MDISSTRKPKNIVGCETSQISPDIRPNIGEKIKNEKFIIGKVLRSTVILITYKYNKKIYDYYCELRQKIFHSNASYHIS